MISSANPSAKYSWSFSALMLANGSTAMDWAAGCATRGGAMSPRSIAASAACTSSAVRTGRGVLGEHPRDQRVEGAGAPLSGKGVWRRDRVQVAHCRLGGEGITSGDELVENHA